MNTPTFRTALPLALFILPACPVAEKVGDNPAEATDTDKDDAGSDTTTTTPTPEPGTTLESTITEVTSSTTIDTDGPSSSTTEPAATSTTEPSDTTGQMCSPKPVDACQVTQCIEGWSWDCSDCPEIWGGSDECFEHDVGCAFPALECDLPRPCDRVWGMGWESIESLENDAAATCLLTALRDGTPGQYGVVWGEMQDGGWIDTTIYSSGQGVVLLEWRLDCPGCPSHGEFRRSGQLALQPDAFFDDCLAAPDTASLIQCVFGFVDFTPGAMPPSGYTPPWATGECVSLEIACPS